MTCTWDRGNQIAAGSKTFSYNFENKLTKITEAATTTEYTYDGLSNRLSQKVGTTTTQFVNDVSGELTKVLVAKNLSTGANNFFVQGPEVLSEGDAAASSRKYYLYDGLGNIRFTTDASGNKAQAFKYDPYGNLVEGNSGASFRYKGEQIDQDGIYFMRARYYDPITGRFITKDPVEGTLANPQSQNGFNYANVDPINLSDPSGEAVYGGCFNANIGVAAFGTCSICAVITSNREIGGTVSVGGGGTTGLATGVGVVALYSPTANSINDLKGQDAFMGGSAQVAQGDKSWSTSNPDIYTYTGGLSFGPDYSPPFMPGEFHGGTTKAWGKTLLRY